MSSRYDITLARSETRLILRCRRSKAEWLNSGGALFATAVLTIMAFGIVVAAAVHGKGLQAAMLMLLAGAVGGASVWEQMQDADWTTEFDLASRTVMAIGSGFKERQLGPVSFDQVVGLDTSAGWIGRSRAAVATLRLADRSHWELGKEGVFVRRISTSVIPSLLAEIRAATGLPGTDDPT